MKKLALGFVALIATLLVMAQPGHLAAANPNQVIYSAIPATLPGNVPSLGFEATQTAEFGNHVQFVPATGRKLATVSVVMSSWGCQTRDANTQHCTTTPGSTFSEPITLNLYNNAGTPGTPALGTRITTKTVTFNIPFRPSGDEVHCSGSIDPWFSATDNTCYSGFANTITFDFTAQNVTLPDQVIWGVAYNTSNYGYSPIGTNAPCYTTPAGCGYDSLNVGADTFPNLIGTDPEPGTAFWNTSTQSDYCNGNPPVSVFRWDGPDQSSNVCWGPNRPMAAITVTSAPALSIGKTCTPATLASSIGSSVCTVTITNNGNAPATVPGHAVLVHDAIAFPPNNFSVVPTGTISPPGAASYACVPGAPSGGSSFIDCSALNPDTINPGQSRVFTITLNLNNSSAAQASVTDQATADPANALNQLTLSGNMSPIVTITVPGFNPGNCSFSLTPPSAPAPAAASTGSTALTATGNACTWSASSNAPWLTITSNPHGIGNASVAYAVAANPTTSPRTGTLTIASQTFTVTQDAGASGAADLTVGKTCTPSNAASAGTSIHCTITVTNSGAASLVVPAGAALVRDDITYPTGIFVVPSATGPAAYQCPATAGAAGANHLTCLAPAGDTIAAGGTRVFTVTMFVSFLPNTSGTITDQATANPNGTLPESNPGNNQSLPVSIRSALAEAHEQCGRGRAAPPAPPINAYP